jgi:hypothetical protein
MTAEEATKESKFEYSNTDIQINKGNERNNKNYNCDSTFYYMITIKIFDVIYRGIRGDAGL